MLVTHKSTVAPASPPSGYAVLFVDNADGRMKVKQSDGSVDVVALDSELQDAFLDLAQQGSAPASPALGTNRIYFDTSNNLKAVLHDSTVIGLGNQILRDFDWSQTSVAWAHSSADAFTDSSYIYGRDKSKIWSADCSGGPQWASVDMGSARLINKVIVQHYNESVPPGSYDASVVTAEYKLQWSDNNSAWTDFEHVTGNTVNENIFSVALSAHRYYRILVIQGEQSGLGHARIGKVHLIFSSYPVLFVDVEGRTYFVNPDSSTTYIRHNNYLDLDAPNGIDEAGFVPLEGTIRIRVDTSNIYYNNSFGDQTVVTEENDNFIRTSDATDLYLNNLYGVL